MPIAFGVARFAYRLTLLGSSSATLATIKEAAMTSSNGYVVRLVEVDSPDFVVLEAALVDELDQRYPGLSEEEPAPHDLLVAAVAYNSEAPIGCCALRQLEPAVGEIKRMFVLPEARGLGVARRLLEALETQGRLMGYSAIRLGSGVRQPEALALYESSGYRRISLFGEYEHSKLCVCYEKALS